jgi:hypothetical protein
MGSKSKFVGSNYFSQTASSDPDLAHLLHSRPRPSKPKTALFNADFFYINYLKLLGIFHAIFFKNYLKKVFFGVAFKQADRVLFVPLADEDTFLPLWLFW